MSRVWNAEDEVALFSLICDHKPAGPLAEERVQIIVQDLNAQASGADFTAADVWAKLELHFNMREVNEIENELEYEKQAAKEKTPNHAEPEPDNEAVADIYSSELSDVEGDVEDLSRLKDDDDDDPLRHVHIIRGRRKSNTIKKKDIVPEEPATRKRTRSVAKLGGSETNSKRRQSRSSPSASTVKRRTRSELTPDPIAPPTMDPHNERKAYLDMEGQETEKQDLHETNAGEETPEAHGPDTKKEEETSKTRRGTRKSARRSGRKK